MEKTDPQVEIKGSYVPVVFFLQRCFPFPSMRSLWPSQSNLLLSELVAVTAVNALFAGLVILFLFCAIKSIIVLDVYLRGR
jgi:hypothetical protein